MKRIAGIILCFCAMACSQEVAQRSFRLNVVEPGHFHAALVQKTALDGVCDTVDVYASAGPELDSYLASVASYDAGWVENVHVDGVLPECGGNGIVVLAGNNARKSANILDAVQKGYNVLSDKPMAIDADGYRMLCRAYEMAEEKDLVICDLMTERYDTLNILTREILPQIGRLLSVETTSVHHFCKNVSGKPLQRPAWYYDVRQQGEGIADVTTHLIDLVMWQCFPDMAITPDMVTDIRAAHYPTPVTIEQYRLSTGCTDFPAYLRDDVVADVLRCYSNGYISAEICGVPVVFNVRWDFMPPEGASDTFQAVYRGENGSLKVVQDASTSYVKQLFIVDAEGNETMVDVPLEQRPGHEAHFGLVAGSFMKWLEGDEVPAWEYTNTLTKYFITTSAVSIARR